MNKHLKNRKLPIVSCNEFVKFLKKEGFVEIRQSGSHKMFKHPDGRRTIVPIHNNEKIGKGLLREILNQIELSKDEFVRRFK